MYKLFCPPPLFARAACSCFIRLLEKIGLTRPAAQPREYRTRSYRFGAFFFTHSERKKTLLLRRNEQKPTFPFSDGAHPKKCTKKVSSKIDLLRGIIEKHVNLKLSASQFICVPTRGTPAILVLRKHKKTTFHMYGIYFLTYSRYKFMCQSILINRSFLFNKKCIFDARRRDTVLQHTHTHTHTRSWERYFLYRNIKQIYQRACTHTH